LKTTTKLIHRLYGSDAGQWYSDHILREMMERAVTPESRVMDAGAGAGEKFPYDFRGRVKEIVGVDLDPRVETNEQLDRGILCGLYDIPIEDDYFDVICCRYVMEHIDQPARFANEMARLLKPGGVFIFLTPQKWHYVCIIARFTPDWFHKFFNEKVRGRASSDTFPTTYLMNTMRDINRVMNAAGMRLEEKILRETVPAYLQFSLPTLLLGIAYERLVNSFGFLSGLRVHIVAKYAKQG